jgi:hypothetical protein
LDDWNAELVELGFSGAFRTAAGQLLREDAARYLPWGNLPP